MNVTEFGVRFAFSTGFDLSAFTTLAIEFTKPSGATLNVQSPSVSAPAVDLESTLGLFPANTYAQYTFVQGDVDEAGEWSARVVYDDTVASPHQHLISDVGTFVIDP